MSSVQNPLLTDWSLSGQFPPFTQTQADHFGPAFTLAMQEQREEIELIANNREPATFDNTIAAFDRSGRKLAMISMLYSNLLGSKSSDELQAVEMHWAPKLAAFANEVSSHRALFSRIDSVKKTAGNSLSEEQRELLNRIHLDFVRQGAKLTGAASERFGKIGERLAQIQAQFVQNVMGAEKDYTLALNGANDLAGLPSFVIDSAAQAAKERGLPGHVITLSRSLVAPFLTYSSRRDLRQTAFTAWSQRGENHPTYNNHPLIKEILTLRLEMAQLLGYKTFADYALEDRMAGTPAAARALMVKAWEPAKQKAGRELELLQAAAKADGLTEELMPWDWRYYAEKVRLSQYALSDDETKPYFTLKNMTAAMFETARRLFGIEFKLLNDVAAYHPDVKVYAVNDATQATIAYFLTDNFSRPFKQGGAWMSIYRDQTRNLLGGVLAKVGSIPIVSNNNNFARAENPDLTLLSIDDVRTLFHEFGHGLHGILSNVNYARISGTNVLQDFVELPSQLFEHWAMEPSLLKQYAKHVSTNEPISDDLIKRIGAAVNFNLGFETVEYNSCTLMDLSLHEHPDPASLDLAAFEREELARLGMPKQITMRHRLPHFSHLFSSNYYAAGYYVYMWAEVLDADAFDAFKEAGDVFDPIIAAKLKKHIYSAGASVAPMKTYLAFRGREPAVEPMLRDRGLLEVHG
jgi:peptidyl-dipeptidase Dcp